MLINRHRNTPLELPLAWRGIECREVPRGVWMAPPADAMVKHGVETDNGGRPRTMHALSTAKGHGQRMNDRY